MGQCQRKRTAKPLEFSYALRSFLGYLEGTEKALHTVRNYRSDLMSFEEFLEQGLGSRRVSLSRLSRADLERYHSYLKAKGFRTNTRRRKLLTLRRLLRYLSRRGKLNLDIADQLPAPAKLERVPRTLQTGSLLQAIQGLPTSSELEARNRALLWALAETGCRVSEVGLLRRDSLSETGGRPQLQFEGKFARSVPISGALFEALRALSDASTSLFTGHNRYGSLGAPISSRGVELLVKTYAARLEIEDPTPRLFRHSAVLAWHKAGETQEEIQRRLGLRTAYSFRIYAPLLKPKA
jgi:site-specific recombinase XerD